MWEAGAGSTTADGWHQGFPACPPLTDIACDGWLTASQAMSPREGYAGTLVPFLHACTSAAGDACKHSMVSQLTCLKSGKKVVHHVMCLVIFCHSQSGFVMQFMLHVNAEPCLARQAARTCMTLVHHPFCTRACTCACVRACVRACVCMCLMLDACACHIAIPCSQL